MIAISYRREDSLPVTGRLYDRLQAEFGRGNVFMDFDSIPYGVDFRDHIKQMIDRSKVLVAMIGPDWVGRRKHRVRRIDDPTDFVRLEIAYALERKLPIIPILVSNTQMPRAEELPKDIEGLAFRNGLTLDVGIDFHHHAERLVGAINRILTTPPPSPPKVQKPEAQAPERPVEMSLAPPETSLEKLVEPSGPKLTSKPTQPPASAPSPKPREHAATQATLAPQAPPHEKISKPIASAPPSKSPQKPQTTVPSKASVGPSWTARFQQSFSRLQQRLMADYLPSEQIGRASEKIGRAWNWKKVAGFAFALLSLAIAMIALWHWRLSPATPIVAQKHGTEETKPERSTPTAAKPDDQTVRRVPQSLSSPTVSAPIVTNKSSATPTIPSILRSTPPPPALSEGTLRIDSTPWGLVFEVIDAKGNHRTGVTPAVVSLALGSAQVIYKNGNQEHRETVSIAGGTWSSVGWTVPQESPPAIAQSTPSSAPTVAPPVATPPPSVNPLAQNGRPWQVWIGDFVRQFVIANESPDPNPTLACYASTVSYFDEKNQDQAYIRQDMERYNVRWPIRHDEIEGDIHLQERIPGQQCLASFKLNFYAESPPRNIWTKGQFAIDLEITLIDGLPKITGIREKTLHQQKGRPGVSPKPSIATKSYPSGIPVQGKPGIVRSPYAPAKGEVDIRRYAKGAQVKCPYTGKIFIAP